MKLKIKISIHVNSGRILKYRKMGSRDYVDSCVANGSVENEGDAKLIVCVALCPLLL